MESRQIKFRDYDMDNQVMRYFDMDGYDRQEHDAWGNIMQYTSLKDKNGVEIYEGDILRTDVNNKVWRISFINYSWHVTNAKEQYPLGLYLSMLMRAGAKLEVIGNIHQNPELL